MSEYQYYEFQTIDRLLTEKEQREVAGLSSHIDVTASQAVVTYSYGDFKHDPRQVLSQYFDAFLYLANWGTRRLMFRFPKGLIELETVEPYCRDGFVEFTEIDPHLIQSAALASGAKPAEVSDNALQQAITRLTRAECEAFLFRLVKGEAGIGLALKHKLRGMVKALPAPEVTRRRSVRQLLQAAQRLKRQEKQRKAEEAEQRRIEELKQLAKREAQAWQAVESLVQSYQSKAYAEAVSQLLKLRELAEFQNKQADFIKHMTRLREQYRSRSAFIKRLETAGLV